MNLDERDAVAAQFGVSPEQVERDHLISHLLAAIADRFADQVHFIGGTALARTHLPNGRLSEDIDLVALGNRTKLAADLDAALERAVARTHGRLSWVPALAAVRDTEAANLRTGGGLSVRIQFCLLGIDDEAAQLYRHGPTNRVPGSHLFESPPSETDWRSQLAGQTHLTVTAVSALATVRDAWARATHFDPM